MWLFESYGPGHFQDLTIPLDNDVAKFSYFHSASSAAGDDAGWIDEDVTEDLFPSDNSSEGEVIVVTGKRNPDSPGIAWVGFGDTDYGNGVEPRTVSEDGEGSSPPADEDVVEITINVGRPLTPSEAAGVENLKASISATEAAIKALPSNALLKLPNGAIVTGAALKEIWAKTDFVINNDSFTYANRGQGEAAMVNGEPRVSYNIGYLDAYDNFIGGMNYLVTHEVGQLTQYGTGFYTDQLTANDISRAILNGAGLDYLSNPGFGYTPAAPIQFSTSE